VRILERHAFPAGVRHPDGHPARIGDRARRAVAAGRAHAVDPVEEESARVARAADLALARRRVRERPQSWHLTELTDGHPHDEGRTAQHEYVAVVIGARDDLFAHRVHSAGGQHGLGVAHPAHRGARRLHARHAVGCHAAVRADRVAPVGAVEQRVRRGGRGVVDDRLVRQRVVGDRRRGPVPARVRRLARRPAQELDGFAGATARLRSAYDTLNQEWPFTWSPDPLIDAWQTGDRLSYHPEAARTELDNFAKKYAAAQQSVEQLYNPIANLSDDQLVEQLMKHRGADTAKQRAVAYKAALQRALAQLKDGKPE